MKNTEASLVSVIIPVYNGERFLGEALHSILVQDYQPVEVIVVDDGSTDHSAQLAEATPGVCVLREPHRGLAATLNQGVRQATGEFLAFLDADDRWLPGKIRCQLAELAQRPELDMIFCHTRQFTVRPLPNGNEELTLAVQPGVSKSALLIRTASFLRVGEFSERKDRHDFLDWFARTVSSGLQATTLAEVLVERRVHDCNIGQLDKANQHSRYLRTLRAVINQRRQNPCGGVV